MLHERFRAVIAASTALIVVAFTAGSALAQSQSQSGDTLAGPPLPRPKHKPIDLDIELPSFDFTQDVAKFLNDFHDEYRGFKKELRRDYDLHYSMLVSIFPQWGTPNGGRGVVQLAYDPNMLWSPFKNTPAGSGALTFSMLQTQYWTKATTQSQQARLGLITPPNNQIMNLRQYNQLMYTHTFPDAWNWLSLTAGQYTFAAFDSNLYAGNAQTNFISYPLTQNGTQAYPNGGLGVYAQATSPDQQYIFAENSRAPPMSAVTRYRRVGSRPANTPISWLESGRQIFLAGDLQSSRVQPAMCAARAEQQPGSVVQRGTEFRSEMGALPAGERDERNRDPDRNFDRVGWDLQQSLWPQPP